MKYFGQYQQDEIIDVLLQKKHHGFFLDIGAHDGITYSNSYFFEKYRNFNGICLEPNPLVFEKLIKNRKCDCLNSAASYADGFAKFTKISGYSEMLSGLEEFRDPRHNDRAKIEINVNGGEIETIEVATVNVNRLVENRSIDFITIDIEGGELDVLKTLDFNKFDCRVLVVEINYENQKNQISELLMNNHFFIYKRVGSDYIYLNIRHFKLKYYRIKLKRAINFFLKR
jgi:FkbM family methyltransferase